MDVRLFRIAHQVVEPRFRLHPGVTFDCEIWVRPLQAVAHDIKDVIVAAACVLLEVIGRRDRRIRARLRFVELQHAGIVEEERAVVVFGMRERSGAGQAFKYRPC